MNDSPSIRMIAQKSGYSTWSVSRALNDGAGVNSDTRAIILKIAKELGYKPNTLVSAVMARNRSSRHRLAYSGNLAILSAYRVDKKPLPFHDKIVGAAHERAEELGFLTEQFLVGQDGMSVAQLSRVLLARGIHGILDLPWNEPRDMRAIEWRSFSAVRMVYSWGAPDLNLVTPDYHQHFIHALVQLKHLGYRRIGLYLYPMHDERILFKWKAAFLLFSTEPTRANRVPILIQQKRDPKGFLEWVKRCDVDLVISYSHAPLEWLREAGCRVPEDLGFFSLNIHAGTAGCAGLDLNPGLIGKIAIETLVGQIHRNERGYPAEPIHISIPGKFHDGPTIRVQPGVNPDSIEHTSEELFRQCLEVLKQ